MVELFIKKFIIKMKLCLMNINLKKIEKRKIINI